MKFHYPTYRSHRLDPLTGGPQVRLRPIVPIEVVGPSDRWMTDACLDSGSDDTVFPDRVARHLGIDLSGAPEGVGRGVGGHPVSFRSAQVRLRLTDGWDEFQWDALVGFMSAPMHWGILGIAGVLQYFDVQFRGALHEVELAPNSSFQGRHSVLRQPHSVLRQPPP